MAERSNSDCFFFISRPPFILFNFFLFCWVCVICAVILNTINIDFMTLFFRKKIHLRGDLKNMFCHFSTRRWTFEIFFLVKVSYLCVLHSIRVGHFKFSTFFEFQPTLMLNIGPNIHLNIFWISPSSFPLECRAPNIDWPLQMSHIITF